MMKTAYDLLEVASTADDETIKRAYLKKVQAYPPEQSPEQFQLIRNAYESIATERKRAEYKLFNVPQADAYQLLADYMHSGKSKRPDATQVLLALKESLK